MTIGILDFGYPFQDMTFDSRLIGFQNLNSLDGISAQPHITAMTFSPWFFTIVCWKIVDSCNR